MRVMVSIDSYRNASKHQGCGTSQSEASVCEMAATATSARLTCSAASAKCTITRARREGGEPCELAGSDTTRGSWYSASHVVTGRQRC
jgi:hypothetical protein